MLENISASVICVVRAQFHNLYLPFQNLTTLYNFHKRELQLWYTHQYVFWMWILPTYFCKIMKTQTSKQKWNKKKSWNKKFCRTPLMESCEFRLCLITQHANTTKIKLLFSAASDTSGGKIWRRNKDVTAMIHLSHVLCACNLHLKPTFCKQNPLWIQPAQSTRAFFPNSYF